MHLLRQWIAVGFLISGFYLSPVVSVRKTRLTWVNGIGYSLEDMHKGRSAISQLFGGKYVSFCYNPTSKSNKDDVIGYMGDLAQAGTQKLGRITEEVNALVK